MSPRVTKSKNLGIYPYFFYYSDPGDIPYDELAKKLGKHPNSLRGMIRPARHNCSIYLALRKEGYSDSQIPAWFARPCEPLVYSKAAPAGPQPSAPKRSGAEDRPKPRTGYRHPTINAVARARAQRPSGFSMSSAPPPKIYRLAQPVYQEPMNPQIEEMIEQIREIQNEEMRKSLNRRKRRRDPPKPYSYEVIRAQADAYRISREIEIRNAIQTMSVLNLIQTLRRTSEHIDVEELKEILSKPFEEMGLNKRREREELKEFLAAVSNIMEIMTPQTGPDSDFLRRLMEALQRDPKDEWKAMLDISKIIVERRSRKNVNLPMLEDQNRRLVDVFWKNFPKS